MAEKDTLSIIKDILHENLDVDPAKITDETDFESLDIDSLDMVELISDLEDQCGIEIGEPEGISNVGDLVAYVDKLRAAK